MPLNLSVAHQHYKTGGSEEYIIIGNDAIIKCNIPSFVSDFVTVDAWVDSEGGEFFKSENIGRPFVGDPVVRVYNFHHALIIIKKSGSHTQFLWYIGFGFLKQIEITGYLNEKESYHHYVFI